MKQIQVSYDHPMMVISEQCFEDFKAFAEETNFDLSFFSNALISKDKDVLVFILKDFPVEKKWTSFMHFLSNFEEINNDFKFIGNNAELEFDIDGGIFSVLKTKHVYIGGFDECEHESQMDVYIPTKPVMYYNPKKIQTVAYEDLFKKNNLLSMK